MTLLGDSIGKQIQQMDKDKVNPYSLNYAELQDLLFDYNKDFSLTMKNINKPFNDLDKQMLKIQSLHDEILKIKRKFDSLKFNIEQEKIKQQIIEQEKIKQEIIEQEKIKQEIIEQEQALKLKEERQLDQQLEMNTSNNLIKNNKYKIFLDELNLKILNNIKKDQENEKYHETNILGIKEQLKSFDNLYESMTSILYFPYNTEALQVVREISSSLFEIKNKENPTSKDAYDLDAYITFMLHIKYEMKKNFLEYYKECYQNIEDLEILITDIYAKASDLKENFTITSNLNKVTEIKQKLEELEENIKISKKPYQELIHIKNIKIFTFPKHTDYFQELQQYKKSLESILTTFNNIQNK